MPPGRPASCRRVLGFRTSTNTVCHPSEKYSVSEEVLAATSYCGGNCRAQGTCSTPQPCAVSLGSEQGMLKSDTEPTGDRPWSWMKGTAAKLLPSRRAGSRICISCLARQRLRLHWSTRNKSLLQNEALRTAQWDVPPSWHITTSLSDSTSIWQASSKRVISLTFPYSFDIIPGAAAKPFNAWANHVSGLWCEDFPSSSMSRDEVRIAH